MCFERIVNLDFRYVSVAREAARHPVGGRQRHDEVVDAFESALDLLTGRCGHGYHYLSSVWRRGRAAATSSASTSCATARYPRVLQLHRLRVPSRDALQVARLR